MEEERKVDMNDVVMARVSAERDMEFAFNVIENKEKATDALDKAWHSADVYENAIQTFMAGLVDEGRSDDFFEKLQKGAIGDAETEMQNKADVCISGYINGRSATLRNRLWVDGIQCRDKISDAKNNTAK